jgi:transcriptional regulator with XRE-family HTH domain
MSTTSLGLELRRLREQAGYTLRGLGAKLDVSAAHLSDIEHNHRRPSEQLLRGLAYELRGTGATFTALEVHLTGIDAQTAVWASITPGVRELFRRVRESGLRPTDLLRALERAITRRNSGGSRQGR